MKKWMININNNNNNNNPVGKCEFLFKVVVEILKVWLEDIILKLTQQKV